MCVLPETLESQRMWDLSPSCMHTKTVLQHYAFQFPNSLLSCAPNHPLVFFVFPCFPVGPLSHSPPPCFTAFSVSHTHPFPFSTACSSPNIIWLPLSGSALLSSFFFPLQPCSDPPACSFLIAAAGGAIELHFPAERVHQFYMHVVATVRFTELKISREGFIAPGEGVEKGCSSGRDLQYSSACQALRQTPRDRFPSEGNCSHWVTGRLNKTQREICGCSNRLWKGFFQNNYHEGLTWKHKLRWNIYL